MIQRSDLIMMYSKLDTKLKERGCKACGHLFGEHQIHDSSSFLRLVCTSYLCRCETELTGMNSVQQEEVLQQMFGITDEEHEALKNDPVNNPKHYTQHPSGIECIDIVEWFTFNIGNVFKYCWRAGLKDETPSLQDLKKAQWYMNREIERVEKEQSE